MRNVEDVDVMLDEQDKAVRMDEEWPGAFRGAYCPRCKRVTRQQFWPHRGGWVCHDKGWGCAQKVTGQAEYDALCEAVENITAQDIWGR